MNNLFTFNKNSKFFGFFEWLWKIDSVSEEFTTMCPLFWAMIFSILFLPIMLVARFFMSDSVGEYFKERRERSEEEKEAKKELLIKNYINNPSNKNLIALRRFTECYFNCAKSKIDYFTASLFEYSSEARNRVEAELGDRKNSKSKLKINTKHWFFVGLSYIVGIIAMLLIGWVMFKIAVIISNIDMAGWILFGTYFLYAIGAVLGIVAIFYSINYCGGYISKLFNIIGKFFIIVWATIVAMYNNNCPVITWKD